MASCCIPVACKPIVIDGVPYYDGALGDTIPLDKAFADGCDKVVLILTKPVGIIRADGTDRKLARVIRRRYPKAAEQLACAPNIIMKASRKHSSWLPRAKCSSLHQTIPAVSKR